MVFWQSPKTRKQARPNVRVPTARAAGIAELEILVDVHERYPYGFAGQQVRTTRRALRLRGLRRRTRREGGRRGRAQVDRRPQQQPDERQAAVRGGRAGRPVACGGRGGGAVLQPVQAGLRPAVGAGRRAGRAAGPLPVRTDGLLRHPEAGRGVDLPLPGRRPDLGETRATRGCRDGQRSSPSTSRAHTTDGPSAAELRAWAVLHGWRSPNGVVFPRRSAPRGIRLN